MTGLFYDVSFKIYSELNKEVFVIKKMFSRFNAGIFVLILFIAFLSACKQSSPIEESLLTMDADNAKSISQTETPASLAVYVPTPICEWPDQATVDTLTPVFDWTTVPGATTYQIQIYRQTASGGVGQRIYTSPYLNPNPKPGDPSLQQYSVLAGVLNHGVAYWWSVRARKGAYSSGWDYAEFYVI